jgi:hypothetical protein
MARASASQFSVPPNVQAFVSVSKQMDVSRTSSSEYLSFISLAANCGVTANLWAFQTGHKKRLSESEIDAFEYELVVGKMVSSFASLRYALPKGAPLFKALRKLGSAPQVISAATWVICSCPLKALDLVQAGQKDAGISPL